MPGRQQSSTTSERDDARRAHIDPDRPLPIGGRDRLGYTSLAEKIAACVVKQVTNAGLVVGIEGEWGTGKSTLINLIVDSLAKYPQEAPKVVFYSPWLIGNRDDLLRSLFDELATVASTINPIGDTKEQKQRREFRAAFKRRLVASLRAFAAHAGKFSGAAKLASDFGMPFAGLAATGLENAKKLTTEFKKDKTLAQRKAELVKNLANLSRRIVIFIDDLDRLEPLEVAEVLRLIRAVADFPNLIYVLSYDPAVVAKTLRRAMRIEDGSAFLQKIVQVSFPVPRPEMFDLRQWYQDEVRYIFQTQLNNIFQQGDGQTLQQLDRVIYEQGGRYLLRPRDVIRSLNALRVFAIPIADQVYLPDLIQLQLIRLGDPTLYRWIETYMVNVAAVANGGAASANQRARLRDELIRHLENRARDIDREMIELGALLPGLQQTHAAGTPNWEVLNNLNASVLSPFVAKRSLGSPQHYRLYFAFAQPSGALPDNEIQEFVAAIESGPEMASAQFLKLAAERRPQGGVMAEVLLDRLNSAPDNQLSDSAVERMLWLLADNVDTAAMQAGEGDFGHYKIWGYASGFLRKYISRMPDLRRSEVIERMFRDGRSLGWLTDVFRDQIFAHGIYGDRAKPESERLLKAEEFQRIRTILLRRYEDADPNRLVETPHFLSLLYGWEQGGGDPKMIRGWIERRCKTDDGLLNFLSRLRQWSHATGIGRYYPLKRRDIGHFLDFDGIWKRVRSIKDNSENPPALRKVAREIDVALEQGDERWNS